MNKEEAALLALLEDITSPKDPDAYYPTTQEALCHIFSNCLICTLRDKI